MTRREKTVIGLVVAIAVAEMAKRTVREDAALLGLSVVQLAALTGAVSLGLRVLEL